MHPNIGFRHGSLKPECIAVMNPIQNHKYLWSKPSALRNMCHLFQPSVGHSTSTRSYFTLHFKAQYNGTVTGYSTYTQKSVQHNPVYSTF